MDVFWQVFFGVAAAIVMLWLVGRAIQAGQAWRGHGFSGSEPPLSPEELERHRLEWDRSHEEEPRDRL